MSQELRTFLFLWFYPCRIFSSLKNLNVLRTNQHYYSCCSQQDSCKHIDRLQVITPFPCSKKDLGLKACLDRALHFTGRHPGFSQSHKTWLTGGFRLHWVANVFKQWLVFKMRAMVKVHNVCLCCWKEMHCELHTFS